MSGLLPFLVLLILGLVLVLVLSVILSLELALVSFNVEETSSSPGGFFMDRRRV